MVRDDEEEDIVNGASARAPDIAPRLWLALNDTLLAVETHPAREEHLLGDFGTIPVLIVNELRKKI